MGNPSEKVRIFQYWDKDMPLDVEGLVSSWRTDTNNFFEHVIFDDVGARRFIGRYFDDKIIEAYDMCDVPAMKADFFRYCCLYEFGGVYADADIECIGDLFQLYNSCARGLFFLREDGTTHNLANDFMIIKHRKDVLLRNFLYTAAFNIHKECSNNIWQVTGPYIGTYLHHLDLWNALGLFDGFTILYETQLRNVLRMHSPSYKVSGGHWLDIQKTKYIFK